MPASTLSPDNQVLESSRGHTFGLIVLLFASSRLLLLLIGWLTLHTFGPETASLYGDSLSSLFCRLDCNWYINIVEHGYSTAELGPGASNYAFYPVYPLLIRSVVTLLGCSSLTAALLISNLCFIAALMYLYKYARLVGSSIAGARLAVGLVCFVPHSLVFSAAYTESLFLLLLIAAMYHLRQRQWLLAGALAGVLSAVRATGIFYAVFALAWLLRQYGTTILWRIWERPQVYLPILFAPLGLFAFFTFNFLTTGDAFSMTSTVAHGWGWSADWPWNNLLAHLRYDATSQFWVWSSLVIFGFSLLLLRDRLFEEFVLCSAILLLLWSGQVANSLLRYSIVLFPVWIVLARRLENRPLRQTVVFGCFGLLGGWMMSAWTLGKIIAI